MPITSATHTRARWRPARALIVVAIAGLVSPSSADATDWTEVRTIRAVGGPAIAASLGGHVPGKVRPRMRFSVAIHDGVSLDPSTPTPHDEAQGVILACRKRCRFLDVHGLQIEVLDVETGRMRVTGTADPLGPIDVELVSNGRRPPRSGYPEDWQDSGQKLCTGSDGTRGWRYEFEYSFGTSDRAGTYLRGTIGRWDVHGQICSKSALIASDFSVSMSYIARR